MQRTDRRRGQALALDYTLTLAITLLLMTGLLVASAEFLTTQQDRTQESQLRVIGQQITADIAAADRLVQAADGDRTVRLSHRFPTRVGQASYLVAVDTTGQPTLRLTADQGSETITIPLQTETSLEANTVAGGPIVVNATESGTLRLEAGDRGAA